MTTVRKVLYLLLLIKTYGTECSLEPGRLRVRLPVIKQRWYTYSVANYFADTAEAG